MISSGRAFKSVLIANRGEIAVRIVREAKAAGLRAIAVYSDADKNALHVQDADAAVHIGPSPARESYLCVDKILSAAKQTGAEAIHPGYGFLSENAGFAQAVIDAGLVWIGPSPDAIRVMGDKGAAKQIARKADVPVIPGYDGDNQSDAHLLTEAKKIGWPILIKAANGGGGRGQRRVGGEAEFTDALASARRESLSAFASDKVILERALENVRHIELQVFGDAHGNIIHLGERDCSLQRRNQKIIEEAPAPGITQELREKMGEAAVSLAHAVGYVNAGTVEYLLDRSGKFCFLEMNTRIQVEHPVTEIVTGLNLVRMQFDVAMGKPLGLRQSDVRFKGYAIEARLCAEDPGDDFRPQTGSAFLGQYPAGVRIDSSAERRFVISGHYDSMIAKVIASGSTRSGAIDALIGALEYNALYEVRSNRNFLIEILQGPDFSEHAIDTGWLSRRPPFADSYLNKRHASLAALVLSLGQGAGWRSTGVHRSIVCLRERVDTKTFAVENGAIDGLSLVDFAPNELGWISGKFEDAEGCGDSFRCHIQHNIVHVRCDDRDAIFEDITYAPAEPKNAGGDGAIRAPMAGKIVRVNVEPGATVEKGQVLVILEAMKMEHEIVARGPGSIATVSVRPGEQVAARQVLATLLPGSAGVPPAL